MTDDDNMRARYVEMLRESFGDRAAGIAREQRDAATGTPRQEWDRILKAILATSTIAPSVIGAALLIGVQPTQLASPARQGIEYATIVDAEA